jgi:hypothetical protein
MQPLEMYDAMVAELQAQGQTQVCEHCQFSPIDYLDSEFGGIIEPWCSDCGHGEPE